MPNTFITMPPRPHTTMTDTFHKSPIVFVTVGTGSTQQTFQVYEELLTSNSAYFKAALGSDLLEGRSKTFQLDEDDTYAFDLFVRYLYRGCHTTVENPFSNNWNAAELYLDFQIRAYLLGDKLISLGFKSMIAKDLGEQTREGLSMVALLRGANLVYEYATSIDMAEMKDALVYVRTRFPRRGEHGWTEDDLNTLVDSRHNAFLVDILTRVYELN